MKLRRTLVILLVVLLGQAAEAQLDRYKYFVVPLQFDGFKNQNQFRTSTLIKHLFTQYGYPAFYDDAIPPDLASRPCQGLRVGLVENSSLLHTKVKLTLKDCYGQVVYETLEGKSKTKEYELAYREAIEEAFIPLAALGYTYTPDGDDAGDEVAAVLTEDPGSVPAAAETREEGIGGEAAAAAAIPAAVAQGEEIETWYAQPVENGYQLVDSTPSVRMKLVNTSQEDTYIAMVDGAPMGMVYKKDGDWWHEFYKDGKAKLRKLRIDF